MTPQSPEATKRFGCGVGIPNHALSYACWPPVVGVIDAASWLEWFLLMWRASSWRAAYAFAMHAAAVGAAHMHVWVCSPLGAIRVRQAQAALGLKTGSVAWFAPTSCGRLRQQVLQRTRRRLSTTAAVRARGCPYGYPHCLKLAGRCLMLLRRRWAPGQLRPGPVQGMHADAGVHLSRRRLWPCWHTITWRRPG